MKNNENIMLLKNYCTIFFFIDEKICPSSLGAYFQSQGYRVKKCSPHGEVHTSERLVPHVDSGKCEEDENSCGFLEFYDWLGACACQVTR